MIQSSSARPPASKLRPRRLVLALALAGAASHVLLPGTARAQALPTGLNVTQGTAAVNVSGPQMTVTNSAGAVLQWQNFSIAAGNSVRFQQPSASSRVLNQVVGNNPSNIFGSLSSNGEVWLVNPYGVLFGRNARVDVASLVVSTLNISGDDWRNKRLNLTAGSDSLGSVVNQGELRSAAGGRVLLLAGAGGVRNEGLIEAPDGQVVLAAGRSIELTDSGASNVAVQVQAPQGEVLNLGSLAVGGGRVDLWAAMVNQQGVVRADGLSDSGGEIVVRATQGVQTGVASTTSASGSSGGQLVVDAGTAGTARLAGALQATGSSGSGGDIRLLGRQVGLLDAAAVDASGASGGVVRIGGGRQGQDATVPNAAAVYMSPTASVRADGGNNGLGGDGGTIILWSDQATRAYGTLSARGGDRGGDGGFIETSGGWLDARPKLVRTDAPRGRAGTWLLDPNNIFIIDGGNNANIDTVAGSGTVDFSSNNDSSVLTTGAIVTALNGGNNVTVTTASLGNNTQAGDIVMFGANISVATTPDVSLTLNASRNISLQSSTIESQSIGKLSLNLNAANGGQGSISIDNTRIATQGGDVILGGPATAVGPNSSSPFEGAVGYDGNGIGVSVSRSFIDAGSGSIVMRGSSVAQSGVANLAQGVSINNGSTLQARLIDLRGWVDSNSSLSRIGTVVEAGTTVSASETLLIRGDASSTVDASFFRPLEGVRIAGNVLVPNTGTPVVGSTLDITGAVNETLLTQSDAVGVKFVSTVGFDASGAETANITGTHGVQLGDGNQFPFLSMSTGGPTTISSTGNTSRVDLNFVQIGGAPSQLLLQADTVTGFSFLSLSGAAALTVSAGTYQPSGGNLQAPGAINILADTVILPGGFSISSGATGDAIVVAGRAPNTNTQTFLNNAGAGVFSTPGGGRWLLYATDPTDTNNFNLGGLDYEATVYGTTLGQSFDAGADTSTGRLLLFSLAPSLSFDGGSVSPRNYDGTRDIDVSSAVAGLVNGNRLQGLFDTKDVGSGKTIELFPASSPPVIVDSNNKPVFGYAVPSSFTLTGTINPAPLTLVGVTAAGRQYDGTTDAVVSGSTSTLVGLVAGESLGLTLDPGQFSNRNVGTWNVTGTFALSDSSNGLVSNYSLSSNSYLASASITPRSITVSGVTAGNKVYDGNTAATVSGGTLSGLVSGETLVLTTSGANFADPNVNTGKTVTGTATLADGSGLASNYVLSGSGAFTALADITARPLTLSGVTAASRPYDGTLATTLSGGVLANLVSGETLTLSLGGGQFDTKNVGTGKLVTGTASIADGTGLASNYSLAGAVSSSADITPRVLTASGITAAGKVYDGTTAATLAGGTLSGLVSGETLTLSASGQFVTKDAGTGKTVNATATLADGSGLASNYSLSGASFSTSADITPRVLSIAGVSASGKVYDGTRNAATSGGTLGNLVTGETLQFATSGLFDTANAGAGKTVTGSVTLQDGTGLASNYSLAGGFTTTADISRRGLTLSGVTAANKVYDGTTAVTLSGGTLTGLVSGETLALNLSGSLVDKNAGLGKAVTGTATLADGSGLASNYLLSAGGFSTSADVARRDLAVAAATLAGKVYDGTTAATVTGWTLNGVLTGDQVNVAAGSAVFSNAGVSTARAATATASTLGGGDAANYQLAQAAVATSAAITPATLSYLATPAVGTLGSPPGTYTGSVTGFVAGETLAGATTGTLLFSTPATAASPVGTYAINGSGLAAANYSFVQAPGNATALTIVAGATTPPFTGPVPVEPLQPEPIRTTAVVPTFNTTPTWSGRTIDVMQATTVDPVSGTTTFGPINLDNIQQDTLAALLEARSRYKRSVLDTARRRLEEDPALADVPPCESVQQVETGKCLVTDEQLAQLQAGSGPGGVVLVQPVAPSPAPAPTPAAPPVVAAPPAPTPITTAAATPVAPPTVVTSTLLIGPARPPSVPTATAPPLPVVRHVRSASLPQIQRKLAVLIGEDNYADDRIPQLDNAGRDALAVAGVLANRLGYDTVVLRDASREAIVGMLNKLAISAQPADSVMIYYAGHGYVVDKTSNGYWIPSNADAERPETWISNNDIDKLVGRIRAQQVVLVSDSCYSGSLIADQRVLRAGEQVTDARTILGRRAAVVMSSGGNEPVADGARNGHSPFALSLMQNMEAVPEWRIGTQLFENVRADVAKRLPQRPQYGTSKLGRHTLGADYLFESRQLEAPAP